ncbi:MAG: peptidylprolyl isomerase [Bacteroidia bacterium]
MSSEQARSLLPFLFFRQTTHKHSVIMLRFTWIALLCLPLLAWGQAKQVLDRIIAIVGDEVILESDVDNQYNYLRINGEKDDGSLRCQVMENLIISKLLLDKARQDSIVVADAEVEAEMDRRMEYILSQIDRSQFEEIYGKSIVQFREDIREDIRNELLVDRQRGALLSDSDITPKEVKRFFDQIPRDSLGLLPAEVMLNHIVIKPPFSRESEDKARDLLADLRQQVIDNKATFEQLAARFTEEPGGRERKGDLGWFGRGQMVPEFEEVVYQMRVGEVSEPFRTEFGYHIVYLGERRGERVHASHILRRLAYDPKGDSIAIDSLNRIVELIRLDSFTFEQAAILYSEDRATKHCGGCIANPQTQDLRIPLDALDAELYFKIDEMKPGEISEPAEYFQQDGSRAFHVVLLKTKIPPHTPNLKDDYQKIRNAALQAKQAENFEEWLLSARKNIYIDIKPTECQNALKRWTEWTNSSQR